jgi:hypothetical protein
MRSSDESGSLAIRPLGTFLIKVSHIHMKMICQFLIGSTMGSDHSQEEPKGNETGLSKDFPDLPVLKRKVIGLEHSQALAHNLIPVFTSEQGRSGMRRNSQRDGIRVPFLDIKGIEKITHLRPPP